MTSLRVSIHSPGFGRNYLIPRGLAAPASAVALRQLEAHKEKIEAKQGMIENLENRLDAERMELEELLREKKIRELDVISDLITENGLEPQEAAEILKEYLKERQGA